MAWRGVMSPRANGRVLVRSVYVWVSRGGVFGGGGFERESAVRTYGVVQVPVPQVIDRASRATHYQSTSAEECDVCEGNGRWRVERV